MHVIPRQRKAVTREANRRSDYFAQAKLAPLVLRPHHPRYRTGNRHGLISHCAHIRNDVALLVPIHVYRRSCRSLFTVIEEVKLSVRHADKHESAAANIARLRMNHRQRESGRDGGVDRISTLAHDVDPDVGRERVDTRYHRLLRMRRVHACHCRRADDQAGHDHQSLATYE